MEAINDSPSQITELTEKERNDPVQSQEEPTNNNNEVATQSTVQIQKKRGGWICANVLLVNQALATLAYFGVSINLVLFLTRVLKKENAVALNEVSVWTGIVYLFSFFAAFISDSYLGRFRTFLISQLLLIAGLILLSITSWKLMLKPKGCGDGKLECHEVSKTIEYIFYLAIYMVAFGYGGHQPTCVTFGADQFDDTTEKGLYARSKFFSCFYVALNLGSSVSNTLLVYYEDIGYWTFGFLLSTFAAICGLVSFLVILKWYRVIKPHGNPIPRISQVFWATFKKWDVPVGAPSDLFEVQGNESAIKGSRKIVHSENFKFLDKAATLTSKDRVDPCNPWRTCTVTQVEEAKCVLNFIPLWVCTIMYSVIFTQMASMFVEQGDVMDTHIFGKFEIPAASMSLFDIISVVATSFFCNRILFSMLKKLRKNPKGLSELERMGIGLIIGILAMAAAGITEIQRLKKVLPNEKSSTLSVLWQMPQYMLVGASEIFMYVGSLEFFNGQAPDGIKSIGSSLVMLSMSVGNFTSVIIVYVVMKVTTRGLKPGWIPSNLNDGHIERFYFLLLGLSVINLVIFIFLARRYKPVTFEDNSFRPESEHLFANRENQEVTTNV
ncbi:unnamed protein product [Amaranthus hypochondriacus]